MFTIPLRVRARALRTILPPLVAALTLVAPASTQAQSSPVAPPAATVSHSGAGSIDDKFVEVGKRVPQFGGMYIRGTTVQVVLLDTSPAVLAAAQNALVAVFGRDRLPTGGFSAVQGQFDVVRLKSMRDQARSLLSISGVSVIDLDERLNRVRIGLERMDVRPEIERQLGTLRIPLAAVAIEQVSPTEFAQGLKDTVRPVKGGLQIGNGVSACSLGLVAKIGSVRGMLTASHCTKIQGGTEFGPFFQPAGGGEIGVELNDPEYATAVTNEDCPVGRRCRWSDSAFAVLHPEVLSRRGTIATVCADNASINCFPDPGDYKVKEVRQFPFWGEVLAKVGQRTGFSADAVIATCEDVNVNPAKSNVTLFCQDRVAAEADKGDSGAPVFEHVPGAAPYGVAFNGILWGVRADKSTFTFSSHWAIEMELGAGPGSLNVLEGYDAPVPQIVQPGNGATVDYNLPTTLIAKVWDPDALCPELCAVTWKSDKDGPMGSGTAIDYVFVGPGLRTITATAKSDYGSPSASITVSTGNAVPEVWITKPSPGQIVNKGAVYVFEGHSSDKELFGPLPCSALKWTSSVASDPPLSGCGPQVTFASTGFRTITLTGTDDKGASATDSVVILVVTPAPNSAPVVNIVNPGPLASLDPFIFATLKGTVSVPPTNGITGSLSYEWRIKEGVTETLIGSGTLVNAGQMSMQWKPSTTVLASCGGSWVKVYLYVTDSHGLTSFDMKEVKVAYTSC